VFDLFLFNDELTLLEIKLHQMAGWVDRFILVEARVGFDGLPKPLHFQENRSRFAAFADRIEHVVVDRFPDHVDTPWARAFHQRDQGLRGLTGLCAPEDLVLLTNADEVLDGTALAEFEGRFGICAMQTFAWFLNLRWTAPDTPSAAVVQARFLAGCGPSYARLGLKTYSKAYVPGAGWRFTRLPGPAPDDPDAAQAEAIRAGEPPRGFERAELDERLPSYVLQQREALADFIL
jgi:hypothetical protein